MDFEELARPKLPPAHWGYMATGVDDDLTLKANVTAYKKIELRPRRLVDVSKIDTSTELFGSTWESPIFVCPIGGHRMFHPDGELATARAAKAKNTLQILSTQASIGIEEVAKARGMAPWFQLYMPAKWEDAEKVIKRVEAREMGALSQKEHYAHYEIDFGRRLVAKFRFNLRTFWKSDTFPLVARSALYPSAKRDPLHELTLHVRGALDSR